VRGAVAAPTAGPKPPEVGRTTRGVNGVLSASVTARAMGRDERQRVTSGRAIEDVSH
jgi:hypothetical protein